VGKGIFNVSKNLLTNQSAISNFLRRDQIADKCQSRTKINKSSENEKILVNNICISITVVC